jgi:hypothetical protein
VFQDLGFDAQQRLLFKPKSGGYPILLWGGWILASGYRFADQAG